MTKMMMMTAIILIQFAAGVALNNALEGY